MKYVTIALLALLSCSSPADRINIEMKNATGRTLTIEATAGGFTKTVRLSPLGAWTGWVPKGAVDRIEVTIKR